MTNKTTTPDHNELPAPAPITGNDLRTLELLLGLNRQEFATLLGLPYQTYKSRVQEQDMPIRLSLYARLLFSRPDMCLLQRPVSFREVLEVINDFDPHFNAKDLVTIIGLQPQAATRLLNNNPPSRTVDYMLTMLWKEILAATTNEEKKAVLKIFVDNAQEEAAARGLLYGDWGQKRKA